MIKGEFIIKLVVLYALARLVVKVAIAVVDPISHTSARGRRPPFRLAASEISLGWFGLSWFGGWWLLQVDLLTGWWGW